MLNNRSGHSNRSGRTNCNCKTFILIFVLQISAFKDLYFVFIVFSGLIQLCPERDLVYKWEKDRDTMNSLQLCIGFAHRVQVTVATHKHLAYDAVSSFEEMVGSCSKFVPKFRVQLPYIHSPNSQFL